MGSCSEVSDPSGIRKYAASFCRDLYKREWSSNPKAHNNFLSGLPQISQKLSPQFAAPLRLAKLEVALGSLQSEKSSWH